MEFVIHDVGHGFCAHFKHDNGNVMVWDCGHKSNPEHRPSQFLRINHGISSIQRFFITNYDQDHVSDFIELREQLDINVFHKNNSINAEQLRRIKREGGPISTAMEGVIEMLGSYTFGVSNPPNFVGINYKSFRCAYPNDFTDTNNLSLVTFLETPMCNVIIPGDLEKPAWEKLLQNPEFRDYLSRVNVFIASHHGRTNGYCSEVFRYCQPDIIVFSDGPQVHATQEEATRYRQHAHGIRFNNEDRWVLSTRNDRTLSWSC